MHTILTIPLYTHKTNARTSMPNNPIQIMPFQYSICIPAKYLVRFDAKIYSDTKYTPIAKMHHNYQIHSDAQKYSQTSKYNPTPIFPISKI